MRTLLTCLIVLALASVALAVEPSGIYVLSGPEKGDSWSNANFPFVAGFALRDGWRSYESGTIIPVFNFQKINNMVTGLEGLNKKFTIAIFMMDVPASVLKVSKEKFQTAVPNEGSTPGATLKWEPVPWDEVGLRRYKLFVQSLANTPVGKNRVPLKNHPLLTGVRISPLGMQGVLSRCEITSYSGYTRDKLLQGITQSITIVQAAFPGKTQAVQIQTMKDKQATPPLDRAVLDTLATFPVKPAMFIENLKGTFPTADSPPGKNYLYGISKGLKMLFQACGSWTNRSPCSWEPTDTTPANGMKLGYETYKCRYYEMYLADLRNPAFKPMWTEWAAKLQ